MGVYYHYVNFTKRHHFSIGAIGGGVKFSTIGYGATARAFELLITRPWLESNDSARKLHGSWEGDHLAIVGDTDSDFENVILPEFANITANVILMSIAVDGFQAMAAMAEKDQHLFLQLCHLLETNYFPYLLSEMEKPFGKDFWKEKKRILESRDYSYFPMYDVVRNDLPPADSNTATNVPD
jgi:hypothetical protein